MKFNLKFVLHQEVNGFLITQIKPIQELSCILYELTHKKSGAKVIHLENEDPENLFCLSFRTTPTSSNGVAHILEHIVLCGSDQFPVRDPFFSMMRRSLNTFMNALTGADFTCYPAATLIKKDFYHLLEVYLDAVFHPLLTRESFYQEGWRYDFKQAEGEETAGDSHHLSYHGIVFNEMKGALSSPTTRLIEALNNKLFPSLTYGINSGGDPACIPSLSYEELLAFHASFYHPSRCLFFFYGNFPLEEHLQFIGEKILDRYDAVQPLSPLNKEQRYLHPLSFTETYPLGQGESAEDKTMVAIGYLTCPILEQEELLALQVIESILMETDASPLKKGLLQSGRCKQVSGYLDGEISEVPFVVIAKGCQHDAAAFIEETILKTLKQVVEDGISNHLIDNAIHQLEFHRHEISNGGYPFGLLLFLRSGLLAQHGGECTSALKSHELFQTLRLRLQNHPRYLEELIRKYLIDNPHRICLTMNPSTTLHQQEEDKEKQELKKKEKELTEKEKKSIRLLNQKLETLQNKKEDISCLPKLTIEDIPASGFEYPLQSTKIGNSTLYQHQCFTNGIIYAGLCFSLPLIPKTQLCTLRLLTSLMTQVGCAGLGYEAHLERLQAHTGGVFSSLSIDHHIDNPSHYTPRLEISGKALNRKESELIKILEDISSSPNFKDKDRLKTLIDKQHTALQSNINSSALKYAMQLSGSAHSTANALSNLWYGLPYFHYIDQLIKNFDAHIDPLIDGLEKLSNLVLSSFSPDLIMTTQNPIKDEWRQSLLKMHANLSPVAPWHLEEMIGLQQNKGVQIASPVAFTAFTIKSIAYSHPDNALLNLAAHIMSHSVLHKKIREQGGAYGGGASQNSFTGVFSFHAYRDPHLFASYEAMRTATETLAGGKFGSKEIEEAIFEIIQSLDSPISPGYRAETAYTWLKEGLSTQVRQEYRHRVLSANKKQIQAAVAEHLLAHFNEGILVSFAGNDLLEKENHKLKDTPHYLQSIDRITYTQVS